MYLYYRPKTNEVVMRSEGLNQTDLPYIEFEPTPEEMNMIEQNYEMYIRNGKVKFEVPAHIKDEEKKKRMDKAREDLKRAVGLTEIRDILLEIIKE